jgi:hypothetical protein
MLTYLQFLKFWYQHGEWKVVERNAEAESIMVEVDESGNYHFS